LISRSSVSSMDFSSNKRIFRIVNLYAVFASVGYLNISFECSPGLRGHFHAHPCTSMISYKYRKRTASALNLNPDPNPMVACRKISHGYPHHHPPFHHPSNVYLTTHHPLSLPNNLIGNYHLLLKLPQNLLDSGK